MTSNNPYKAKP